LAAEALVTPVTCPAFIKDHGLEHGTALMQMMVGQLASSSPLTEALPVRSQTNLHQALSEDKSTRLAA
jgi:hypothetical protein